MNFISFLPSQKQPFFLLVSIVFLVFFNTLFNNYNLDDNLVTRNHPLNSQGVSAINKIFVQSYYSDSMGYSYGYRPIVHLSFALENQFFGDNAFVSHLFNLIFYCLSVLLLFKLLNIWLGEKNKNIALFASILFAVHPIHSEVVASIKNRDEILAFLFMLLSALSIDKFLVKKSFLSLLGIILFFTIGMLSKKSIFPMAFFLPIVFYLLFNIDIKKITGIFLLLILTSTFIATDFQFIYSIKLISIQLFGLVVLFLLKKYYNEIIIQFYKNVKHFYKILIFISWICTCCFLYFNSVYFFLFSVLFLIICLVKGESFVLIQMILQLAIIGFTKDEYNIKLLSVLLLFYIHPSIFLLRKKDWLIVFLAFLLIVLFLFYHHTVANTLTLLTFLLFFYLFHKKKVWSLIFSLTSVLVSILYFNFSFFLFLLVLISLSHFVDFKKTEKFNAPFLPIIILLIISMYTILFSANVFFKINPPNSLNSLIVNNPSTVLNFNTQNSISTFLSKEGRALQYVENTLILPHTFSETVGTGLFTLGTYLRLLVWPDELSFYYGFATINTFSFLHLKVLSCLLLLMLLLGISIFNFPKHPFIFIGFGWFLCSILLFSNWVELVAGMVGERLAFNASAGFCLFIAAFFNSFKQSLSLKYEKNIKYIFVLLIIIVSIRTVIRNADWKDPLTLMRKDIVHLNQSAQAHNLLALNLMEVSTSETSLDSSFNHNLQLEAIQHFKRAATIYPSFFNVWYDLGRVYTLHNDFLLAKSAFEKAYVIDNNSLLVLEELVKTCFNLKLVDELEYYGTTYLKKDEFNEMVHELLSYIMFVNNKYDKSFYYAKNGLKYYPNNRNLQLILMDSKK